MKKIRSAFLIIITISVYLTFPGTVRPESAGGAAQDSVTSGQIIIHHSDTFDADYSKGTAVFSGNVVVEWDNITLSCRKLELYYENSAGKKGVEDLQASIKGMTATGDVIISRQTDQVTATAEKVEYSKANETMVMTGSPVFKRGRSRIEGSILTLELKNNTVSGEDIKADLVSGEKR